MPINAYTQASTTVGPFGQHQCTSLLPLYPINLSKSNVDEVVGETKYFQDKCLLHNLIEAETYYRDIIYMLDKDIVVQERRGKHERICHMTNLLQEIASNAEVGVTKAEQALQLIKGINGRKEEEDFWKKILLNRKAFRESCSPKTEQPYDHKWIT